MPDPEIRPALTPEQWAKALGEPYQIDRSDEARWALVDGCLMGEQSDFHAAAALCLYGQPYGFTAEDVALLRDEARQYANAVGNDTPTARRLRSIADRIAALLPSPP